MYPVHLAACGDPVVPVTKMAHYGPHSFAVVGPSTWISLQASLCDQSTIPTSFYLQLSLRQSIRSLSLIPGLGVGSPPRSAPGSSIGVLGRFDSGDLAMTPAAPGRVLGSVTPDVLPSCQHHCNVDKWLSLDVRCDAGRPPTMENGPYAVEPL